MCKCEVSLYNSSNVQAWGWVASTTCPALGYIIQFAWWHLKKWKGSKRLGSLPRVADQQMADSGFNVSSVFQSLCLNYTFNYSTGALADSVTRLLVSLSHPGIPGVLIACHVCSWHAAPCLEYGRSPINICWVGMSLGWVWREFYF